MLTRLERHGVLREQLQTKFFAENAYDTIAEDAFNNEGEEVLLTETLIGELDVLNLKNLADGINENYVEETMGFYNFYK